MSIVSRSTQQYSGFDPRTIPGCALWLDAADRNTISFSSGSTVSQWRDKSGNGRNFDVASGTPSYEPSLRFVRMSSSTIMKSMEAFTLPVNMSMFLVAQRATTAGADTIFMEHGPDINSADGFTYYTRNQYLYTLRRTVIYGVEDSATTQGSPVDILGQTMLHVVTYAHPQIAAFFLNGVSRSLRVTDNRIPTNTETTQRLYLNGRSNGTVISDVRWAEVILFTQTLTTAQRQQVEGYLAQKWNMSMPGISPATISQTPVFYPTSISNCALWLDAADSSSIVRDISGNISQWKDKSGNEASVVQTNANLRPSLTTSGPQGIQLATNTFLATEGSNISSFSSANAISVFIVARNASTNSGWNIINTLWFNSSGVQATTRYHFSFNQSNVATAGTTLFANGALVGQVTSNPVAPSTMAILGFTASSTSTTIHTNGSSNGYAGVTLPSANNSTLFMLGDNRNSNVLSSNIAIYEFIGYSGQLTTDQRTTVEQYLAQKWGLMPFYTTPAPALWLDAADSSTFDLSGTSIVRVRDKSSNTYVLSNARDFSYSQRVFNGSYPSFFSSNVSSVLGVNTSASISQPASIFIVGQPGFVSNSGTFPFLMDSTNSTQRIAVYYWGSNGYRTRLFAGSEIEYTGTSSSPFIHSFIASNASSSIFTDGVSRASGTIGTGFLSGITVGNAWNSPTNLTSGWVGHIAEVLIYNSVLSTSQRQSVESYLANKWGISTATNTIVPQLALWLDAADQSQVGFSSGSNVNIWRDKSGNSRHLGVTNGTPVYRILTGNMNCIQMPVGTIMNSPSITLNSSTSLFIVAQRYSTNGLNGVYIEHGPDANSNDGFYYTSYNNGIFGTRRTNFLWYRDNTLSIPVDSTNVTTLHAITYGNPSNLTFTLNGTVRGVTAQNTNVPNNTTASQALFLNGRSGNTLTSDVNWCEVILFDGLLSSYQRQLVEGYLAAKWGLRTSLPSTHPYTQPFALPVAHPYRSLAPAVRPFLPIDIDGLALWLDAADSSTLSFSSGSNVSQWRDKATGVIAQYTTGIGSVNPPVSGSTINGVNALLFDRTLLPVTASLNTTNRTYFIVANLLNGYTNGIGAIFWATTVVNSYVRGATMTFDSTKIVFANQNVANLLFLNSSWNSNFIISATFNNGTTGMWNNGGGTTTATGQSSSAFGSNGSTDNSFVIGGTTGNMEPISASTADYFSRMLFGEMLIYNSSLTTSQRQQVEGYLAAKWGLSTSLPPAIQAVPSIFDPRRISGCQLWLDAADSSTLTFSSGSNVSAWNDKSGNGRNATVQQAAPTFVSNVLNGLPVVRFSNPTTSYSAGYQTQFLNVPVFNFSSTTASRNIFVVAIPSSTRSFDTFNYEELIIAWRGYHSGISVVKNNTSQYLLNSTWWNNSNPPTTAVGTSVNISMPPTALISSASFSISGSTATANTVLNGSPSVGTATMSGFSNAYTVINIGCAQPYSVTNGYNGLYNGDIAEILVYEGALTTAQRQQVEGYLYAKWNVPVTRHPYYRIQSLPTTPIFTPASLSGLQLWLDGADPNGNGTLPTSGSQLVTWVDKSGNTNNANGVNNGGTWTIADRAINLNGTNQSYLFANPTTLAVNKAFIFFIVERRQKAGVMPLLGGTGESPNTNLLFQYGEYPTGQYNTMLDFYGTGEYRTYFENYSQTSETTRIWTGVYTGSQRYVFLNGRRQGASYNPGATSPNANDNFSSNVTSWTGGGIGRIYAGRPYDTWYQGKIYEIIWFTSLTDSQRQAVEGYLAWKWGLQNNLPLNFNRTIQSPLQISGCSLWFDGSDPNGNGILPSSGASLSTWVDKSGNNRNATQATVSSQPTFSNGRVNFNGSQFMTGTGATLTNSGTLIGVGLHNGSRGRIGTISSAPNTTVTLELGSAAVPLFYNSTSGLFGSSYSANNVETLVTQTRDGASNPFYSLNGGSVVTYSTNDAVRSYTNTFAIGSDGGTFNAMNGYIQEFIVFNRALSTSERQSVEAYLQTKWNVAVPAAHPYKNFRP